MCTFTQMSVCHAGVCKNISKAVCCTSMATRDFPGSTLKITETFNIFHLKKLTKTQQNPKYQKNHEVL